MAVGDLSLNYGAEATYGTAAALTRTYETQIDGWKRNVNYLRSQGFSGALHTVRKARSKAINMGSAGAVELDVMNKGMGLLLRDLFGVATGPTQQAATIAYVQTYATTATGPQTSATIQAVRAFADSGTQAFTYVGCLATGWEFSCETGDRGFLHLRAEYDAQDELTATAAGASNLVANADLFDWGQAVVTIGGSAVDMKSLSVKADYNQNVDRRFMRGSYLKKKPRYGDVPAITGQIEGEFDSMTQYNHFINSDFMTAQFKWTGALIVAGHNYEFTIDMPSIQYSGDTPEASLTESPKISLPFTVYHDPAAGAAVTVTLKSTDTVI
jgi:hypothetical protein